MGFLTPTFQKAELECARRVKGQLAPNASNGVISDRITAIDEAGEDCRQKLDRAKLKIEVFNDIVRQQNESVGIKEKQK